MSIASELNNLEGNIEDSYDAVNDMGGIIPAQRNMDNLDQAIRTIPQNTGTTYTAGYGIDIDQNDEISVDTTVIAEKTDIPTATSDLTNDGSDGSSTYVEASDLAAVATSGDYGDLLNTPTIPTNTSDLTNDGDDGVHPFLATDDVATVATSGDYDDLLNKPTIPTVNDATLTIQHNGTNVQTFTANASSNATANIETIYADTIAPATAVAPITTDMIADGAVTAPKIGLSTLKVSASTIWSGSLYQTGSANAITLNEPLIEGNVYIFTMYGLSSSNLMEFVMTYRANYFQCAYYDGTTVVRWRINITDNSSKLHLDSGSMNMGTNTAIIRIAKIGVNAA